MKFVLLTLVALSFGTLAAQASDWAYQGADPGFTKYSPDNLPASGSFQQLYSKRFYSKYSADINPNYNFSTGVLVRNGQAWVISNDQADNGNWYSPIVATGFDWTTGATLTHSSLPGYGSPTSPRTFHPNENDGELDAYHCNFPALWAPDGRIYARRGGDQRCLGAMNPTTGVWTVLPFDGGSDLTNGYDTPGFINWYGDKLLYHGGYAGGPWGYAAVDVSAAAWSNGTQGQYLFQVKNASPYHSLGVWSIDSWRDGDNPKAAANVGVLASWSTDPSTSATTMYVTASNLTTGTQMWTKNYATNTCGQMGKSTATSDYWRYMATEDGKYVYYVRNAGQTQLHVANLTTGDDLFSPLSLVANSDPLMAYHANYVYVAGAHEQMKIDAATGAVVWRQTNTFSSDAGYMLTQQSTYYSSDPLYRPVVLTNDGMWWVDGYNSDKGRLIEMSTADGSILQNIDLAAMVKAKNPNERLIAVNDLMDANGKLGLLLDIGDITDPNYISGYTNKVKYQDLYVFGSKLPGDANGDNKVTFADYIVLELNFGSTGASWTQGDFNGDGKVDFKDYIILEGNFGKSVPEPGMMSLLFLGGLAALRRRSA